MRYSLPSVVGKRIAVAVALFDNGIEKLEAVAGTGVGSGVLAVQPSAVAVIAAHKVAVVRVIGLSVG
jgi:hypothetical protein